MLQRTGAKPVKNSCGRYKLPHSLGNAPLSLRTGGLEVKIAFLQRQVKILRGQIIGQEGFSNLCGVASSLGPSNCPSQPWRGFPFLNVIQHFLHKTGRHINFTLTKNSGDTQNHPFFGADVFLVNFERFDKLIIFIFHEFPAGLVLLDPCDEASILAEPGHLYYRCKLKLHGFHGIKDILGQ